MIRSFLLGAVAGMRALTPFAAVSDTARRGALPQDSGAPPLLGHPLVTAGAAALAAGELVGDKLPSAPDRIVPSGMIVRAVTGAVAGMSLAPHRQRVAAALLGAGGAVGASYLTFALRMRAMKRFGQVPTGLVEDALMLGSTLLLVRGAAPAARA